MTKGRGAGADKLPGSAVAGTLIALIGASNLAQGGFSPLIGGLNLTIVAIPLLAIMVVFTPRRFDGGGFGFVLLFLVSVGVGYLAQSSNSYAPGLREQIVVTVLIPVVLVFFAPQRWRVSRSFATVVILLAVVTAVLQFVNPATDGLTTLRRTPEGLNPINSGRILAAGALSCLVALRWAGPKTKYPLVLLGLVLMGCSGLTGSRGSVLAALIVGSLYILLTRSLPLFLRLVAWAAVAAPVYMLLSGDAETGERLRSTSDNGRVELVSGAWRVFVDNPMGVGWGNLFNHLASGAVASQGEAQYPHNIFVEFAAEAGVIGVVLLCACLWASFRGLESASFAPEMVVFMVLGSFSLVCALTSTNIVGNRLLWVCMAIGLGSLHLRPRQAKGARVARQIRDVSQR